MRKQNLILVTCLFVLCSAFLVTAGVAQQRRRLGGHLKQIETLPLAFKMTTLQEKFSAASINGFYGFYVNTPPKGFEDVGGIDVVTRKGRSKRPAPAVPRASVFAQHKFYNSTRFNLNGNNLSFETVALKGVSYQFTGMFHKVKITDEPTMFLKGHLIKSVNGRKVAEADVDLQFEPGEE